MRRLRDQPLLGPRLVILYFRARLPADLEKQLAGRSLTLEGFLEFVRGRRSGPLFFDPKRRKNDASRPQQKIAAKNVAAWVHRLGLDVGRRHRKDPNHGWRHLFRTLATEAGVPSNVISAVQGHAPGSVGESYGEVSLLAKHRAIQSLQLPGLWP